MNEIDRPCGCMTCQKERSDAAPKPIWRGMDRYFRFSCELCGCKRCPHHTDHRLACTGSNESGQPGSWYGGSSLAKGGL